MKCLCAYLSSLLFSTCENHVDLILLVDVWMTLSVPATACSIGCPGNEDVSPEQLS